MKSVMKGVHGSSFLKTFRTGLQTPSRQGKTQDEVTLRVSARFINAWEPVDQDLLLLIVVSSSELKLFSPGMSKVVNSN